MRQKIAVDHFFYRTEIFSGNEPKFITLIQTHTQELPAMFLTIRETAGPKGSEIARFTEQQPHKSPIHGI